MKASLAFVVLLAAVGAAAAQQQEPNWVDVRFYRVHLHNGNVVDGQLVKQTDKEVVLLIQGGEIHFRNDVIERLELVKMRSLTEKPLLVPSVSPSGPGRAPLNPGAPRLSKGAVEVFDASPETREKIDPCLVELGQANPERKQAVMDNMSQVGLDTGPYLASLLTRVDLSDISVLTAVIVKCHDTRAIPLLIRQLASENPLIRTAAASALGGLGDDRAISSLIALIDDKDPTVKQTAVTAIADVGGPRALDALLPVCGDGDRKCRSTAIQGSFIIATKIASIPTLLDGWTKALSTGPANARVDLLAALARLKNPDVWKTIVLYVGDDSPAVRASAATSLAAMGAVDAAPVIASQANSENNLSAKIALAQAAGQLKIRGAVDALIRWLGEEDANLKREAVTSLQSISGQQIGDDPSAWAEWRSKNPEN